MDKGITRSLAHQLLIDDFPTDVSRIFRREAVKDRPPHITKILQEVAPKHLTGAINSLYRKVPDLTGLDHQTQPRTTNE
jgi:hypothetical protein